MKIERYRLIAADVLFHAAMVDASDEDMISLKNGNKNNEFWSGGFVNLMLSC